MSIYQNAPYDSFEPDSLVNYVYRANFIQNHPQRALAGLTNEFHNHISCLCLFLYCWCSAYYACLLKVRLFTSIHHQVKCVCFFVRVVVAFLAFTANVIYQVRITPKSAAAMTTECISRRQQSGIIKFRFSLISKVVSPSLRQKFTPQSRPYTVPHLTPLSKHFISSVLSVKFWALCERIRCADQTHLLPKQIGRVALMRCGGAPRFSAIDVCRVCVLVTP